MPRQVMLVTDSVVHSDIHACAATYPCVARLGNGDLLIVFSKRPFARRLGDAWTEVGACISGIRSSDNGRTWTSPFTLIDTPDMLDYDPNIVVWDDKALVISTAVPMTHNVRVTASKFLAIRSEDNGRTWSEPAEIPHPGIFCCGKIHRGIRFPDGALAFGFSMDRTIEEGKAVLKDGDCRLSCALLVSRNDGRAWKAGAMADLRVERASDLIHAVNGLDEPALALCRDGSVYMLMRTGLERLYETRTSDQGKTWSAAVPTPLVAHNSPADLCVFEHPRLGRGWLAVYDHSPQHREPLAVAVTLDEGRTWSNPLIIVQEGTPSYPGCVQTAAGDILLAWQEFPLLAGTNERRRCYDLHACLLGLDEIDKLLEGT